MSGKKDERDIDEILASIDAMLAEGKEGSSTKDTRKDAVDQAARESENTLGLSSTASEDVESASKLKAFEPLDIKPSDVEPSDTTHEQGIEKEPAQEDITSEEAETPRQRIVLTEEYLEPAAQESLPLWAAQTPSTQDEPAQEPDQPDQPDDSSDKNEEINVEEGGTSEAKDMDIEDLEASNEQAQPTIDAEENTDEVIGSLDDFEMPDLDAPDEKSEENLDESVPDKTFFFEAAPAVESATTEDKANEESAVDETPSNEKDETEPQASDSKEADEDTQDKTDEFDAVFDAIANDDTITFDISEAMDEDTLYDIQVLDSELVEAFVQDVVQENEALNKDLDNQSSEQTIEKPIEEAVIKDMTADENHATEEALEDKVEDDTETSEIEGDVDTETDETVDDETSETSEDVLTEQVAEAVEQSSDELISLNPDELDPLIEAVSDEVRIKINQHLQQILPELISEALLEHLANQRDDSGN